MRGGAQRAFSLSLNVKNPASTPFPVACPPTITRSAMGAQSQWQLQRDGEHEEASEASQVLASALQSQRAIGKLAGARRTGRLRARETHLLAASVVVVCCLKLGHSRASARLAGSPAESKLEQVVDVAPVKTLQAHPLMLTFQLEATRLLSAAAAFVVVVVIDNAVGFSLGKSIDRRTLCTLISLECQEPTWSQK